MDTKQLDTLRLVSIMELSGALPGSVTLQAAAELRRQHAEIETLRAGKLIEITIGDSVAGTVSLSGATPAIDEALTGGSCT